MYSEYLVEVNMDYPVRVATKLKFASRWRIAGEVAEAKVWDPLRVASESGPTRNKIRRC